MAEPNTASLYSQDLRGRRVRLLDLSPVLPGKDEPLAGDLRIVSLDGKFLNPNYEALSYVWGKDADSPSCRLRCSGVNIPITQNCDDALRILHSHFGVRTIWVDAICINQDNAEEKEHQIPLMRDIFVKARRVFVWLGHGTRESDEALDWAAQESASEPVLAGVRFKVYPAIMLPSEVLRAMRSITLIIEKYRLRRLKPRQYDRDALQDIVERPWFRRMWTLQELFMANEPLVVCGTKSIRWNDLCVGITSWGSILENRRNPAFINTLKSVVTAHSLWVFWYQKYLDTEDSSRNWIRGDGWKALAWHRLLDILESKNMLFGRAQDGLMIGIMAVRFLLGQRPLNSVFLLFIILTRIVTMIITPPHRLPAPGARLPWETNLRITLVVMMNFIRSREAKQPVDKVFALYGLFQSLGIPLQRPDYSKSVGQVYLEFTCALIQWHGCLEMLKEASRPSLPGQPTWVPDWSRSHYRILGDEMNAAGDSAPNFAIVSSYDDTGVSPHDIYEFQWTPNMAHSSPIDIPKIITQGFVEDEIAFCLPPLREAKEHQSAQDDKSNEPLAQLLYNTAIMLHWLSISQQPRFHIDPSPLSISETLFSIMHSEVWKRFNHRSQLRELFPDWLALLNIHLGSLSNMETPDSSAARSCARDLKADERLHSYHLERCEAIAGKRIFFTTQKGRLGTGSPYMRDGDVVALLAGLNTPLILRGREEGVGYEVVGVAYVEGLMCGEAWRMDRGDIGQLILV